MQNGGSDKRMKVIGKLLTGGSCGQLEKISNVKKPFRHVQFPAHFFLIQHQKKGYILVDTGYSEHFLKATNTYPYSIYAKITPIQFQKQDSAIEQLKKLGIEKEDVTFIFISHFHADHVSGLRDFPNATYICSKKAYEFVKNRQGIKALKHGFIPSLLPEDFEERVEYIEERFYQQKENEKEYIKDLSPDKRLYDVLGDGSLLAMDLSGHAIGQFGLYFETEHVNVWWIADAVWDSDAYKQKQLPSRISKLIIDDYQNFINTMKHIHHYHQRHKEIFIVPGHCRTVKAEWDNKR